MRLSRLGRIQKQDSVRWWPIAILLIVTPLPAHALQNQGVETDPPGTGPFSRMSMTLAKRLFFVRVDVLDLEVHFGVETAGRLEAAANGRELTPPLEDSIAEIATTSRDAYIRLRFLRDIDLERFIKAARENTESAYRAKIIDKTTYLEIATGLPDWYASLRERGIKKDDTMLYRVRGDGLRTIYRGVDGAVYLDDERFGAQRRLAILGSYFAPESEFRKSLIRSLFFSQPTPNSQ